jgi:hypothetical protein
LTKFIYSLVIGISLLFIPTPASAEDVIINLDATTAYVDVVVQVDTTTAYTITTTTGPRFEVVDSVTVERVSWVDSWLWLYRGVADSTTANPIRGDDDSNHNSENNYFASALSGVLNADTYTIRATSYDYVVGGQRPIGTYTLSSNLIPPRDTSTVVVDTGTVVVDTGTVVVDTGTVVVDTGTVVVDTGTVVVDTNTSTVDGTTATVDTSTVPTNIPEPTSPVQPPLPETGPILIMPPFDIPQEIIVVEEIIPEELPPVEVIEDIPVIEDLPDIPEEIIEVIEDLPIEEVVIDEEPITIEEAVADIIAEAEANGEAITTEDMEEAGITLADLPADTPVQLDNGVVIEAGTVVALQLLESPAELISAIFDNPAEVLTALSNIGADMSEEERTESENTIIASVIATQAAVNAVAVTSAARTATPTPTSGGTSLPSNDNIKLYKRRKP